MSEVSTPEEQPTEEQPTEEQPTEEQPNPREQPNPEEVTEEHLHDVFTVPSEIAPDVVEALEDAGFELSTEPEPQPYPEPPNVYESGPESSEEATPEESA